MANALIIYASMTGNTEAIALILEEELNLLGIQAEAVNCLQADADEFLNYDICIIATYTYGREGDIPDEFYYFFDDLGNLDLTDKIYGVLGSGEEFYGYYCRAVDTFDEQFQKTGAIKGADSVKIELNPEEKDKEAISAFANGLHAAFMNIQKQY